ncbi:hypothetical protein KJ059_07335 [Myxococcota bacterium]|nr:hypothetical protein [Myxococcota bacterium]MCZ7618550.1 hypothetical protein [Myxococcota bacterium]
MSRLLVALACVFLLAGPAHALEERDADRVPVVFDILTRAAFGIPLTILGGAAMIPVGFVTAITRPSEIDKPFRILVLGPVRYTWVDPLGYHPDPGTHPMVVGRDHGDRYVAQTPRALPPTGTPSGD